MMLTRAPCAQAPVRQQKAVFKSCSVVNVLRRADVPRARSVNVMAVAEAPQASPTAAPQPKKIHPSPLTTPAPATYAIIEIGGVQMFVEPGKWYTCNRLKADVGAKIKFGRILALKHDGKLTVGQPYLSGVNVEAEILEECRGPKIIVYKMKPKKHYRRKTGHRQDLTKFRVNSISL